MDVYEKALKKIKHDQACRPCVMPIGVPGPMGPTGPQGIEGATGPTGPAPDFAIGNVITGAPGTQASVTIRPVLFY